MQHQTLTRALSNDIELRSTGDGRTVLGIVVPYDTPTNINDLDGEYTETIKFGTFARSIAERSYRVKLLAQHNRQAMPLGRATLLEERREGLYGEFRVSETVAGDEVLELIRDGALDSFSIGFQPLVQNWSRNRAERTITTARLIEVSVVNFPAYESAQIAGVRSNLTNITPEQAAARLRLLQATYQL